MSLTVMELRHNYAIKFQMSQSSHIGPSLNDFGKMGANLTATDGDGWTAVEHMPNYLEVVGSLPTGSWAFLSSSSVTCLFCSLKFWNYSLLRWH